MKPKLIYLAIVIAGFIILYYIIRGGSFNGSRNTSFAVNPGTITRIEMYEGDNRLTLSLDKDVWKVNKTTEARKSAIRFIIDILENMKIKSPVSAEIFRNEIVEKDIIPVRVSLYSKWRHVKSFLVYGTGSNIYGNIMKMKPSSKPYILYLPGFENNIGSVFTTNELFWQPFSVFNYLPGEIATAEIKYTSDPASSFKIINNNGEFSVSADSGIVTGWDAERVRRYLSYFISIPFESWAFELTAAERDSIKMNRSFCTIKVTGKDSTERTLTIWEKLTRKDSTYVIDTDRAYGQKDNSDELVIVRYFDIDPLLKKRSYFFGE